MMKKRFLKNLFYKVLGIGFILSLLFYTGCQRKIEYVPVYYNIELKKLPVLPEIPEQHLVLTYDEEKGLYYIDYQSLKKFKKYIELLKAQNKAYRNIIIEYNKFIDELKTKNLR